MTVKKSLIFAAYGVGILLACALIVVLGVVFKLERLLYFWEKFDKQCLEYRVAVQERDFAQALELASSCENIAMKANVPMKMGKRAFEMKALAYEFLGDFDAALENYEKGAESDSDRGATIARLAYKKGEKAAAFEAYCAYFEKIKGESRREKTARIHIMREFPCLDYDCCGESFDCRVLCPFADYASFLSFMEAEFKAQGEPSEKVPAMEFFRSLTEIEADAE